MSKEVKNLLIEIDEMLVVANESSFIPEYAKEIIIETLNGHKDLLKFDYSPSMIEFKKWSIENTKLMLVPSYYEDGDDE